MTIAATRAGASVMMANTANAGRSAAAGSPLDDLVQLARAGSPVEQGQALRALDAALGARGHVDAAVRAKEGAKSTSAPTEICTVEVRYTPVARVANHAFIVTTDGDSQRYFRGGPVSREGGSNSGSSNSGTSGSDGTRSSGGNRNAGMWGTIVTEHGAYRPNTVDWTTSPSGRQEVARLPGNCDRLDREFARHADDIEAANISYGPLGANSNSTAREILERAGFPHVTPIVAAPSWSIRLPPPR